jgi:long-chain acyl-CoA synthetase
VSFSTREELVNHPKVKALYESIVGEGNRGLARYETLKKILLVPDEFTASDGTLTPTLKLRRRAIEARYREQIDELYREADTSVVA